MKLNFIILSLLIFIANGCSTLTIQKDILIPMIKQDIDEKQEIKKQLPDYLNYLQLEMEPDKDNNFGTGLKPIIWIGSDEHINISSLAKIYNLYTSTLESNISKLIMLQHADIEFQNKNIEIEKKKLKVIKINPNYYFSQITLLSLLKQIPNEVSSSSIDKQIDLLGRQVAQNKTIEHQTFEPSDIEKFASIAMSSIKDFKADSNDNPNTEGEEDLKSGLFKIYFAAYYNGKYIDRNGIKYDAPIITTGIDNNVIATIFKIWIDSYLDSKHRMYVLKDKKGKYLNQTGEKPTIAELIPSLEREVGDSDTAEDTITVNEAKAINLLSGISSERSKLLSGIVVRSFGGFEAGVVVLGGDFSVGNNETIAVLADTLAERLSYRLTYIAAFNYALKNSENEKLNTYIEIIKILDGILKNN